MGESDTILLNKARFGDFTLEYDSDNDGLAISRRQQVILRDQAGQVENLGVTGADWEVFRSLMDRIAQVSSVQPVARNQQQESDVLPVQSKFTSDVAKVSDRQIARLPDQPLQRFLQSIVQGTATWLNQSLVEGVSDRITQSTVHQAITQFASLTPEGQHEADYAFRVKEAEQTVRDFLTYMKMSVWDYEQGKFRLEMIDNQILITSKQDGRGQIHGPAIGKGLCDPSELDAEKKRFRSICFERLSDGAIAVSGTA